MHYLTSVFCPWVCPSVMAWYSAFSRWLALLLVVVNALPLDYLFYQSCQYHQTQPTSLHPHKLTDGEKNNLWF